MWKYSKDYICGMKLIEGQKHCLECPFTSDKIKYGHKYGEKFPPKFYITQTGKPLIGECQDFELQKDLAERLKDIPDEKKLQTLKELLKNS